MKITTNTIPELNCNYILFQWKLGRFYFNFSFSGSPGGLVHRFSLYKLNPMKELWSVNLINSCFL